MASPFKSEIILDGTLSSKEARLKWEQTIGSQARKAKVKGKPLFLHSKSKEQDKYVLHYYQSYGKDFCDTMFIGEIFEFDDGNCQLTGKITVSTGMKRFACALIAASIPLAFLFNMILYHAAPHLEVMPFMPENFLYNEIFTLGGALLVIITIAIMCLIVDKRRVESVTDYLHEFLKEEVFPP